MFTNENDEKFISEQLSKYLSHEKIVRYNLLYRSKTGGNINQLLKKKPNTLLLILTKQGHTIAAYSSLSYCETMDAKPTKALLISTHSKTAYQLKQNGKAVTADINEIIFGNSCIRINKTVNENMKMRVNVDRTVSIDVGNTSFMNVFGYNGKEIQIEGFELYEIVLKHCDIIENKNATMRLGVMNTTGNRSNTMTHLSSTKGDTPQRILERQNNELKEKVERYQKIISQLKAQNQQLKKKLGIPISNSSNNNNEAKNKFNQQKLVTNNYQISKTKANEKDNDKQSKDSLSVLKKVQSQEGINKECKQCKENKIKVRQLEQRIIQLQEINKLIKSNANSKLQNQGNSKNNKQIMSEQNNDKAINIGNQIVVKQQKQQFQNKIHSLTEQLKSKQQIILNSQKQLNKVNGEIKILQTSITDKDNELSQLKAIINQNKNQVNTNNTNLSSSVRQITKPQKDNTNNNTQNINTKLNDLQSQIKVKQKYLKDKQLQISKKEIDLQCLLTSIESKNKQLIDLQSKIKQSENKITSKNNNNQNNKITQEMKIQLANLKKQTDKEKKVLQVTKEQIRKNQTLQQSLNKKKVEIQNEIKIKTAEIKKLQQKENKIKISVQQMEQKVTKLQQEKENALNVIKSIEQNQQKANQMYQQVKQLTKHKNKLEEQCFSLEKSAKQQQSNYQYMKKMNQQLQLRISKLKKQDEQYKCRIIIKQKQLKELQTKISSQSQTSTRKQSQTVQPIKYQSDILLQTQTKSQIMKLNSQLSKLNEEINQKRKQLENIHTNLTKQGLKYGFFPNRLFVGNVIEDELDRQFIIDQIRVQQYSKITKTKLLYSYSLMQKLNPHIFIDGIPNYVIIMTLKNRDKLNKPYMLAMYSEKPLVLGGQQNRGKGFVASVTNKVAFKMVANDSSARLTEYSDYFIVFGKAQIQFKIGNKELQFCIGHNTKSLDTGNYQDGSIFSGDTNQKTQISDYQIYQLIF